MKKVRVGIIGGGLMGREAASAFSRWCALMDMPICPELVAVADLNPQALRWFERISTVKLLTDRYQDVLASPEIDVVYVAVPHNVHEQIYLDTLSAGKDLLAEKPFGIDLDSANNIMDSIDRSGCFVRCSSEFPFLPGAQLAYEYVLAGKCGRILEAASGFHHASDLDANKKANWKRQSATCGEIGVLGDLGLHVFHLPLRLGWQPTSIFAQLQHGFAERPDGEGGMTRCDTWDNAVVHAWANQTAAEPFTLRFEMKRLAPGATNTWYFEVRGTDGGVRYSTSRPKTLEVFEKSERHWWKTTDLGFELPFKTITGGIFEVGFPDIIQQMWAAFLLEREDQLDGQFGCATPAEAVQAQRLYSAALNSQKNNCVVHV